LSILFKILNEDKPEYIAVAFDLKAPTFRHIKYEKYKANRKGMPEELAVQVPILKEILDAMSICRVEMEGFEADDIIGTLAKRADEQGHDVVIFTGDRDAFQLIDKNICVKLPSTKLGKTETEEYGVEEIKIKYGVMPKDLIEVKGLMGDSSDNIPGVYGIGEKTALSYIQKYGTIEVLYENLDDTIVKPKARELLTQYKEDAFMSRELATINTQVPVDLSMSNYKLNEYNCAELYRIFSNLEFNNFIKKLNLIPENKESKSFDIKNFDIVQSFDKLKDRIKNTKKLSFYIDEIDIIKSINNIEKIGIYTDTEDIFLLKFSENKQEMLRYIFENENIRKLGINTKNLYVILKKADIDLLGLELDLSIAGYVLDPTHGEYSLNKIAYEELGIDLNSISEQNGAQISMFPEDKGEKTVLSDRHGTYDFHVI
jgi:DNA polymerase-1